MSRAFVKEPDGGDPPEPLPDRPISSHANFVTARGLERMDATLRQLHEEREGLAAGGDRARLDALARELRYWSQRRATAQLIDAPADAGRVRFGSTVTIERDDGRRQTVRIVGEDEADPAQAALSYVSPLARALLGREVGEEVKAGATSAEIVAIV
jgi:transcription elongation GreA/GreB family factor